MNLRGHALTAGVGWSRALVAPWTLAALALASAWVHPLVVVAGLAAVSAAAVHEWRGAGRAALACVPLQYGLVAFGGFDAMTFALPLVATLFLPLWSVCSGDVRALAQRAAQRFFALMIVVYALSHAAALVVLADRVLPQVASLPWLAAIAAVALAGLVAAGGARLMTRIGLPQLAYVGAIAFPAPLLYHALFALRG